MNSTNLKSFHGFHYLLLFHYFYCFYFYVLLRNRQLTKIALMLYLDVMLRHCLAEIFSTKAQVLMMSHVAYHKMPKPPPKDTCHKFQK